MIFFVQTAILCLFFTAAIAQATNNVQQLATQITDSIPSARFYFVGQAHNNKANTQIEQALLFALNQKHNVTYDILEHGHSTAMLLNEYLRSGDTSVLNIINADAPFSFIKSVRQYNDTTRNRKIYFYGIDFEGRENDKYLKKAVDIILNRSKLSNQLQELLANIVNSASDMKTQLSQLKAYITNNETTCRSELQNYYTDLLLITHAQYGFSSRRDESMYENFKLLYNELLKLDGNPKFIASFGFAHINPKNHQGISYKLQNAEDSPIRDKVCTIGIEYYNSFFGKENKLKQWDGNLSLSCNNKARSSVVKQINSDQQLIFIPRSQLSQLNCNGKLSTLYGLILVSNTVGTAFYTWE